MQTQKEKSLMQNTKPKRKCKHKPQKKRNNSNQNFKTNTRGANFSQMHFA